MSLSAGRLRHRIRIERPVYAQDPVTGEVKKTWELVPGCERVPAEIVPLSVREFIAAQGAQSEVTLRVVIRHRPGIDASVRVVHKGKVFDVHGALADPKSGLEYLTLPCSEGVNDG